jgi:hypothetical protein
LGERSSFFIVICAQHAGDVRIVFGVAIRVRVEELLSQIVVALVRSSDEAVEVLRHVRYRGRCQWQYGSVLSAVCSSSADEVVERGETVEVG